MRNTCIFSIVTLVVTLLAAQLHAAFILDDFDDPAEVASPEMEGELIETPGVGFLGATRTISVSDIFTNPQAHMDVELSTRSQWTIVRQPQDAGEPLGLAHLAASYSLPAGDTDFTQNGVNDAILVDFTSLQGNAHPAFLYVLVRDHSDSFEAFYTNLSSSSVPFTAALPFAAFRGRGGGSDGTDFRAISRIVVDLVGNGTVNGIQEQGWTAGIERIRVGTIPEPCALAFWALATSQMGAARMLRGGGH